MESAKECVTTHLPNGPALKMDGAEAGYPNSAFPLEDGGKSRRAWGLWGSLCVSAGGTAPSADLGGSSKYSREILED